MISWVLHHDPTLPQHCPIFGGIQQDNVFLLFAVIAILHLMRPATDARIDHNAISVYVGHTGQRHNQTLAADPAPFDLLSWDSFDLK
jgi:hypothetical protein